MKKRKNPNKIDCIPLHNPVVKFAHQFNKAHVFEDKNKSRRNAKHRKQEAASIALARVIREASWRLDITTLNLEIAHSLNSDASSLNQTVRMAWESGLAG